MISGRIWTHVIHPAQRHLKEFESGQLDLLSLIHEGFISFHGVSGVSCQTGRLQVQLTWFKGFLFSFQLQTNKLIQTTTPNAYRANTLVWNILLTKKLYMKNFIVWMIIPVQYFYFCQVNRFQRPWPYWKKPSLSINCAIKLFEVFFGE